MKLTQTFVLLLGVASLSTAAFARDGEVEYPEGALGYGAILAQDYPKAEEQLRDYRAHKDDPARLINYGTVLANTGRPDKAARQFKRAMQVDNVELVLADGTVVTSRDAALQALRALQRGDAAR